MRSTTVRIGYSDIPIEFKDLASDDTFGYFEFYPTPRIAVEHRLSAPYAAATAFHEVLEATSAIYGMDLTEGQIRTLETLLIGLVRGNPGLVQEWIGHLGQDA